MRAVVFELARPEEVRRRRLAIRAEHNFDIFMTNRMAADQLECDLALVTHDGVFRVRDVRIVMAHTAPQWVG